MDMLSQARLVINAQLDSQYSSHSIFKLTTMLDLLVNVMFSGRFYGGLSQLQVFDREFQFLAKIKEYNLPHCGIFSEITITLGPTADRFRAIINRLARTLQLPSTVRADQLLITSWEIVSSDLSMKERLAIIVILYKQDLAKILGLDGDGESHPAVHGKLLVLNFIA